MTTDAFGAVDLPMLAAGVALLLAALVGLLVLRRRARRGAAGEVDRHDALAAELDEVQPADPAVETEPDADRHPDVRALRAQVRVLEEALEQLSDAATERPDVASYRAQVRAVVETMARRAPGEDRATIARVAAALARLDADGSERVLLPAAPHRIAAVPPVTAAPEPVQPEPVQPEPVQPEPVQPEPVQHGVAEPRATVTEQVAGEPVQVPVQVPVQAPVEVPVRAQLPEEELVLPVPPPAPAEDRRHRRWLRRSAA